MPPGEGTKEIDGSRTRPIANSALDTVLEVTLPRSFDNDKENKSVPLKIAWFAASAPVLFSLP